MSTRIIPSIINTFFNFIFLLFISLLQYFYIIDDDGNKIYYFKQEEDAADQLDYNYQTNAYYEKSGMFDENGFAIDEHRK